MSKPTESPLDNSLPASEHPPICMWIGCCDARVVPESALRRQDGEVFTHRNISNLFQDGDTNLQGAFSFAMSDGNPGIVEVYLVGHTDCGGAKASYGAAHGGEHIPGPLGQWLGPLITLSKKLGSGVLPDELVVKSVEVQFAKLVASEAFRSAGRLLTARGRVYNVQERIFDPRVQLNADNNRIPADSL